MSATNRGSIRVEQDAYQTPLEAIYPIFGTLNRDVVDSFLEPCKGDGNIIKQLNIKDSDYCEIKENIDYLTFIPTKKYDLIVTNPPFSLAEEFLRKSIKEASCVCYLLRLNFLGSQKRVKLWRDIGTPDKLIVLSKRPSFMGKGTDATEYAWFIWDEIGAIKLYDGIHVF